MNRLGDNRVEFMVRNTGHFTINFSAIPMYEVYSIQKAVVEEMNVREGTLIKHIRE